MSSELVVTGLTVAYLHGEGEQVVVVDDVAFQLEGGSILGVAGESGCGKSTAALAALGYKSPNAVVLAGQSNLDGVDLLALPARALREIWGRRVAYVAQDAARSLNPLKRISWLLAEPLESHLGMPRKAARARSIELLESVGIPDPETALRRYPHEFSGGQQQRIALALAMSCRPEVLVLDEPTTGLDVTTQAQISRLILSLVRETGVAALYISHDLGLLATVCDRLAIMYAGEIVEQAPAHALYDAPRHPYAAALISSAPRVTDEVPTSGIPGLPPAHAVLDACSFEPRCAFAVARCTQEHPLLEVVEPGRQARCLRVQELEGRLARRPNDTPRQPAIGESRELAVQNLRCTYPGRHSIVAVDDVTIEVAAGETLGVVGESGSGKSTLLRAIAGLHTPESGLILFEGAPLAVRASRRTRQVRRAIQLVFQHPDSSLNPRHTVKGLIERPLRLFSPELDRAQRRRRVLELLADVRLDEAVLGRYPHQLSGGQKQRVALARAFAAEPRLILCDEVVSALDVSVQASILELLARLADEKGTALVFVTHDLAVVRSVADRVCVMRGGVICESGPTRQLFEAPEHPYTRTLLDAVPDPSSSSQHRPPAA